ncbi:MAG TPA: hypothetical protein VG267_15455 [Terracidiphilus sp.]|jgi:hypothetical protein|nr:hypothetical protein [Terracidiphilus sp.]
MMGFSFAHTEKGTKELALALPSTNVERWADVKDRPRRYARRRQVLFDTSKLGCVLLALAVFLSGSAYKFSLYQFHSAPIKRASVAKMWLETRNARTVTDVLRKVTEERHPVTASLGATQGLTDLGDLGPAPHEAPRPLSLALIVSPVPARAPPYPRFCLA